MNAKLWLISPRRAVECLIHGFELPSKRSARVGRLVCLASSSALTKWSSRLSALRGLQRAMRIRWKPSEGIKAIVKSWPAQFDTARAKSLGFPRDEGSFDGIIDCVRDEGLKL